MGVSLRTGPTVEPVSLAEIKVQCRVTHNGEDDLLTSYGIASRQWCENYCWRALLEQTWRLRLCAFPFINGPIYLPRPPALSVTTFSYEDSNGDSQTLTSSDYQLEVGEEPAILLPAIDTNWPTTEIGNVAAVTIDYKAGYGTAASNVPQQIKQAILMLCSHWYKHREPVDSMNVNNVPFAVESLLGPYMIRHHVAYGAVA